LAKLADYALAQSINFIVDPKSEQENEREKVVWAFCNLSVFSEKAFFIFVPFDKEKQVIFPKSENHQIYCLAHELGHFKLKDSRLSWANKANCPIWISRINKDSYDNCLLKEILTDLEAIKVMKTVAGVAMKNSAWQKVLMNRWLQCSACLKGIKDGVCPDSRFIGKALRALARAASSAQKEIAARLERRRMAE
jgi:hypothetical protein